MKKTSENGDHLANQVVSEEQIQEWVEQFHRDGFLFLQDVLPQDWCDQMRADLDWALKENPNGFNGVNERTALAHRMFETSETNLKLFDLGAYRQLCRSSYRPKLPRHPQQFVPEFFPAAA